LLLVTDAAPSAAAAAAAAAVPLSTQVCPANWKPGDKTIIADPERSLDYFEKAHKVRTSENKENN
jgi:alkyl hydroperoxide reductase subunit AhpC